MEFVNADLIVVFIVISLNPIKMEHCNAPTSSQGNYFYFDGNPDAWSDSLRDRLFSNCKFGRIMAMQEERLCFNHCTLRDNCVAVNTTDGCQMCYLNEQLTDPTVTTPYIPANFYNIYVRENKLGKFNDTLLENNFNPKKYWFVALYN